jgi:hypothetical protein
VLGKKLLGKWQGITQRLVASMLAACLVVGVVSCSQPATQSTVRRPGSSGGRISEVATPIAIQELRRSLEAYQPQVKILSPRADEVLQDTQVSVKLQVQDLPIFQDEELKLGSHLHLLLDNQPYGAIYDTKEPIVFDNLEPGTHTIRTWDESFKNEGAYAQTTFHVFAKTPENKPDLSKPLLTYSRPQSSYGAEPILLDFYISNVPLHLAAQEDATDDIPDWQIRCTVNGESFTFDRWEPIYLKGLKPGKNWIQMELLDDQGNPFPNAFNNTVRVIEYQPGGQDTLAQLTRGEIPATIAPTLVDPNYEPPAPEPEPIEEIEEPTPALEPIPAIKPVVKPSEALPIIESPQPIEQIKEKTPEEKPDIKAIEKAIEEPPVEIRPVPIQLKPIEPEKPATIEPPVSKPSIPEPTAIEAPVIKAPVIKAPVIKAPVIEQPVINQPIIKQPVIEQPIIRQPIVEEAPKVEPVLTAPEPVQAQPVAPMPIAPPRREVIKPKEPAATSPARSSEEVRQRAKDKMGDASEKLEDTFDALRERSGKVSEDTQKFFKRFRKSPEAIEQQRTKGLLNRFQQPVGKMNDDRPIIDLDDATPDFVAPVLEPIE